MASSLIFLSGMALPPRSPSLAVIRILQPASRIRSRSESAEKPAKTTEWMAPMRAQASMV